MIVTMPIPKLANITGTTQRPVGLSPSVGPAGGV